MNLKKHFKSNKILARSSSTDNSSIYSHQTLQDRAHATCKATTDNISQTTHSQNNFETASNLSQVSYATDSMVITANIQSERHRDRSGNSTRDQQISGGIAGNINPEKYEASSQIGSHRHSTFANLVDSNATSLNNSNYGSPIKQHHYSSASASRLTSNLSEKLTHRISNPIGISYLPEREYIKSAKRGFQFNIATVGEQGLGKTTLIQNLFDLPKYTQNQSNYTKGVKQKTLDVNNNQVIPKIEQFNIEVEHQSNVKVKLNIVEYPGYNDSLGGENQFGNFTNYVDTQFENYWREFFFEIFLEFLSPQIDLIQNSKKNSPSFH